jgi:hypothetical protein
MEKKERKKIYMNERKKIYMNERMKKKKREEEVAIKI